MGWTYAIKLSAGDILLLSNDEYVVVEKVQHEILESPVKVYNFEVEDFHTYFVGESSVLVFIRFAKSVGLECKFDAIEIPKALCADDLFIDEEKYKLPDVT